jgi:hypothetical protein
MVHVAALLCRCVALRGDWQVRDPATQRSQCAQLWCAHANRVHPVEAALSPCGRYAAVGSEDRSAYVYDLRRSSSCGGDR